MKLNGKLMTIGQTLLLPWSMLIDLSFIWILNLFREIYLKISVRASYLVILLSVEKKSPEVSFNKTRAPEHSSNVTFIHGRCFLVSLEWCCHFHWIKSVIITLSIVGVMRSVRLLASNWGCEFPVRSGPRERGRAGRWVTHIRDYWPVTEDYPGAIACDTDTDPGGGACAHGAITDMAEPLIRCVITRGGPWRVAGGRRCLWGISINISTLWSG